MADNPIKYSDFIQPDGSISDLIKQLEQVQTTYGKMRDDVVAAAKELEAALKKVNNTTAEGQEQTKKGASEADQLAKAYDNLANSQRDSAKQLADLKRQQAEQNNINKLTAKLNAAAEGSYDKLSAQYSLNKIKLNAMSEAQRKGTKEGQALEKESKALYEEMKKLQSATGMNQLNVGNYAESLSALPGPMAGVVSGTKAMHAQFLKLMANPIVALIALIAATITGLVSAMKRSEEGQDRLNKVMTVASSIFENIMDVLTEIGVALFDTLPKAFKIFTNNYKIVFKSLEVAILSVRKKWNEWTGDVKKADEITKKLNEAKQATKDLAEEQVRLAKEIGDSFDASANKIKNFGNELRADARAAAALADAQSKYNKDERKYIVENSKLQAASAKARAKAEEMKQLDATQSIKLMSQSFDQDEKALANELDLAKQRASILKQKSALATDDIETKKAIAQAEADVFNAESKFDETRRQRTRMLNKMRQEAFSQEQERSKALIAISQNEQASIIRKNQEIISSDKYTYEEKQKALLENAKFESEAINNSTKVELGSLQSRKDLKLINDEDYAILRRKIESKQTDELLKINEDYQKQKQKIEESKLISDLNLQKQSLQLELNAAGEGTKTQIDLKEQLLEKEREIALASNALKSKDQQQSIDLITKEFDAKRSAIENEHKQLALIQFEYQQDLAASEFDLLRTTEAEKTRFRLEQEKERLKKILELNKSSGTKMSDVEVAIIQNTIKKIDKEISESERDSKDIYSLVGLKLDDDQKAVIEESTAFAIGQVQNFLQAKVDAAQAAVDAANTEVDASQKKLDAEIEARNNGYASNVTMAQKEFELAKKNQEKALKEQEKAQKAQKAIDTLQQVSSLVTATAGIWKSFAGTGPWGVALAIAGTALMWGSFAAAKIKASQLTKKEYGEGGLEFLQGGSHASGNDIPIGYTRDGKDRRAEGGEALAIIRKSQTRKYRKLLPGIIDSLNKGTFEQKYLGAYDTGDMSMSMFNTQADLRTLEGDVREIKKQGERRYFTDGKGRIIETYKNLRRIYNAN